MKVRALWGVAGLLFTALASAQPEQPPDPEVGDTSAEGEPVSGPALEALSQAELNALGLEAEGPRVDTDFHFWGFADFTSYLPIKPRGAAAELQGRSQAFYVGNFNVYLSKNLSESFRTMGEVRFSYLPNGSFNVTPTGYTVSDTSTVDYANGQSVTRWGAIMIQRVYLEWTVHRFITVRGGQFLTPIGIWNVDHGSPAYIPAQRPLAIVSGLFPTSQMGLEVLGRWNANNEHSFGYHLTLSNGTGPISEYKDLDRNKALGARVYWEFMRDGTYVRAGASGYYGRDTNATPSATISASSVDLRNKIDTQSDNLTLAGDVLIKHGGWHVQSEWITQQRRFTKDGRLAHQVFAGPVAHGASSDTLSWVGYVLFAYRFKDLYGLTPFLTVQTSHQNQITVAAPDIRFRMVGFTGGLNVSPIDSVVFKLEAARVQFPDAPPVLKYTVRAVLLQAAWSF